MWACSKAIIWLPTQDVFILGMNWTRPTLVQLSNCGFLCLLHLSERQNFGGLIVNHALSSCWWPLLHKQNQYNVHRKSNWIYSFSSHITSSTWTWSVIITVWSIFKDNGHRLWNASWFLAIFELRRHNKASHVIHKDHELVFGFNRYNSLLVHI